MADTKLTNQETFPTTIGNINPIVRLENCQPYMSTPTSTSHNSSSPVISTIFKNYTKEKQYSAQVQLKLQEKEEEIKQIHNDYKTTIQLQQDKINELKEALKKLNMGILKQEYEEKLEKVNQEIEELTNALRNKNDQITLLKEELKTLQERNESSTTNFYDMMANPSEDFYTKMTIEEAKTYLRNMDSLMDDFIRQGRKIMNNDEVEKFLRNHQRSIVHFARIWTINENNQFEKINPLTSSLVNEIKTSLDNLVRYTNDMITGALKQLEIIKKTKQMYMPYYELIIKIKSTIEYEVNNINQRMSENNENLENMINKEDLENILKKFLSNKTPIEEKQEIKKLNKKNRNILIKLQGKNRVNNVIPVLEEKVILNETCPQLLNIRRTLNNNVKVTLENTGDKEILENLIENDEGLKEKVQIIDLDKKKIPLLILNVPEYLHLETLQNELDKNFGEEIKIMNPLKTKSANLYHWKVEATPHAAKELLKRKRITIFMNRYTTVKYIKILRCSFCQYYGHVQKYCPEDRPICANCAKFHQTNECPNNENEINCANCIRNNNKNTSHKASSIQCPCYQELKTNFLNNYYTSNQRKFQDNLKNQGTENVVYCREEVVVQPPRVNIERAQQRFLKRLQQNEAQRNQRQSKQTRQLQQDREDKNHPLRDNQAEQNKGKNTTYKDPSINEKFTTNREETDITKIRLSKENLSSQSKTDEVNFNPKQQRQSTRSNRLEKYYKNPPPPFTKNDPNSSVHTYAHDSE